MFAGTAQSAYLWSSGNVSLIWSATNTPWLASAADVVPDARRTIAVSATGVVRVWKTSLDPDRNSEVFDPASVKRKAKELLSFSGQQW